MISRITRSLMKRRNALQEGDAGFTLIELLVVVLIIGILAAIAIPIFIAQQNGAKDSGAQNDLATAKTAMISYYTQNNAYTTTAANLSTFGFTPTTGDTFTIISATTSPQHFCMSASAGTGNTFYVTESLGVSKTACT